MAENYKQREECFATKTPRYDPDNAQKKILSNLENKLGKEKKSLQMTFKIFSEVKDNFEKSTPILVFCFLTSRIDEDIREALDQDIYEHGIDEDYNIILVLVHFKRKFTLKDHPLSHDEHLLEDKRHIRLRDKKRIVHFAFHSDDKGLYKHEENTKGMESDEKRTIYNENKQEMESGLVIDMPHVHLHSEKSK